MSTIYSTVSRENNTIALFRTSSRGASHTGSAPLPTAPWGPYRPTTWSIDGLSGMMGGKDWSGNLHAAGQVYLERQHFCRGALITPGDLTPGRGARRLSENPHLRRYPHPSSLRRTDKYASFLSTSDALHLSIFQQPPEPGFSGRLLGVTGCFETRIAN
jgi:hypothetical protein